MKGLFLIIIFIIGCSSIAAQEIEKEVKLLLDSVAIAKTDNAKITYYLELANIHHNYQPDKSIEYARKALTLSKKNNNQEGIVEAYSSLFNGHYFHGSNADSIFKYIQLFERQVIAAKDSVKMINVYWAYSLYYGYVGQSDKDIEYTLKTLKQLRKYAPSTEREARLLNNIAVILADNEQYGDALKYYKEALIIVNDKLTKGNIFFNIGMIYKNYFNKSDSAQIFFEEALLLYRERENSEGIASVLAAKAVFYSKQEPEKAEDFFFEALTVVNDYDSKYILHEIYIQLAEHYYYWKRYSLAKKYGEKALTEITKRKFYNTFTTQNIYNLLHKVYAETGQYEKAYNIQADWVILKDSLSNVELLGKIERLKTEYEVEKKEIKNELFKAETKSKLKQQQLYIILSVVIILFLVLGAVFFFRQNQLLERKVKERSGELITANRKLEAFRATKLLEEAKSKFFANISHEFRTPLTLIQGPIQSVLNTEFISHRSQGMLKRALSNSKQLLRLISQMLDLSKLDNNKLILNEENVVFYILIRRIISNFETYAQQKEITLKLEYQLNADLQIETDTDKIEKVLNNYLSNAIKFTPKEGMITVIVSDYKSRLQIAVQDTGKGIPSKELAFVFNRFYQVKDNHYEGGTGIGLSLCKDYAGLLGGKVWAVSPIQDNNGSAFYFEFPKKEIFAAIVDEDAYQIEQLTATSIMTQVEVLKPKVIHNQETFPRILLVEDNHDLREFLIELLEDQYQIVAVGNGKAALKRLKTLSFELIISDVMMPIMDGFELLENLKSNDNYRHIPVMMLTARAEFKDKLKALRIGVDDYMLKPFNEEELKARVSNLILNFNSRQEVIAIEKEKADLMELPKDIKYSQEDKDWLIELEKQVEKNLSEIGFSVEQLASELYTSRSQLYRKMKQLTGLSVQQYVKEARLQRARFLIETNVTTSVKETAYQVGFKHVNYFSQSFEKRFGKRPSAYLE